MIADRPSVACSELCKAGRPCPTRVLMKALSRCSRIFANCLHISCCVLSSGKYFCQVTNSRELSETVKRHLKLHLGPSSICQPRTGIWTLRPRTTRVLQWANAKSSMTRHILTCSSDGR